MKSISTSKSKPDIIVSAEDLSLVFNADVHRPWTFRDLVVKATQDPTGLFMPEKDRLEVARNLNFEIRRGDRVAIMGVNGVGKTSLCRCIAGMYRQTSGKLTVHGRTRAIFDTSVGIQPELTGRENAYLLADFMYPEVDDHREMIEEALEFSELGKFTDVPYRLYSNGMQARLALSVVSCLPSDLLILDEVFDGADSFFKEKVATRVVKMIETSGAVIFVSHAPDQVRKVCNRLIVLHQGQIAYDGAIDGGLAFFNTLNPRAPGVT